MKESADRVTLEDVDSDRINFEAAKAKLKKRAPIEWVVGGLFFSATFAVATWFVKPSSHLGVYILIVFVSFLTSAVVVFLNSAERARWYRAKATELDGVENRIRSGELVPRPKRRV